MSKRQTWIGNKIRKLVGEGKSNKQAVAIALAMAANRKFEHGGVTGDDDDLDDGLQPSDGNGRPCSVMEIIIMSGYYDRMD